MSQVLPANTRLLAELRGLIEQAREQVAQTANSTLTLLYWAVGERIVSTLSTQLLCSGISPWQLVRSLLTK